MNQCEILRCYVPAVIRNATQIVKLDGRAMKPLNTWLKFWSQVEKTPGCWLWSGWADRYGRFNFEGRASRAHVYAYEKCVGPVPAGLEIDHECDNPLCVNPSHLRAVTHRKNWERGSSPTAILRRRTHCVQGHQIGRAHV